MEDSLKIACGVFGGVDVEYDHVFPQIYLGLRAQNHRGHQSHGFLTFDGRFNLYRGLDLVPKIEQKTIQDWLNRLPGHVGIGNVRYTTSGEADEESLIKSAMPVKTEYGKSKIALSLNGNVVNTFQLKKELSKSLYSCGHDAELFCGKLLAELMGSDDLAFVWNFGDCSPHGIHLYANTGGTADGVSDECKVIFDQLADRDDWFDRPDNTIRTPEVNPISVHDTISHAFDEDQPYYFYVTLTVMDDDVGDGYPSTFNNDGGYDMEFVEINLG